MTRIYALPWTCHGQPHWNRLLQAGLWRKPITVDQWTISPLSLSISPLCTMRYLFHFESLSTVFASDRPFWKQTILHWSRARLSAVPSSFEYVWVKEQALRTCGCYEPLAWYHDICQDSRLLFISRLICWHRDFRQCAGFLTILGQVPASNLVPRPKLQLYAHKRLRIPSVRNW